MKDFFDLMRDYIEKTLEKEATFEEDIVVYDNDDPEQAAIISIYKSAKSQTDDFYTKLDADRIYKVAKNSNSKKTKVLAIEILGAIAEEMNDTFWKIRVTDKIEKLI